MPEVNFLDSHWTCFTMHVLHRVGWTWCIFAQQQSSAPHIWGLLDKKCNLCLVRKYFFWEKTFLHYLLLFFLSWISTVYCGYLYFLCVPKTHLFIQPVCRKLVSYVTVDVSTEIVELNNTQPFSSRSLLSSQKIPQVMNDCDSEFLSVNHD